MKKYEYVPVEVIRECAYCDYHCDYESTAYCRWGQVEIWRCPKHGKFEVISGPMSKRGDQIR